MARRTDYSGIRPDIKNANKGTERGRYMVEASLRETGAGRSILLDKDGRIIAGNKTFEAASDIGLPVRIVQTDGRELVAVQRTDLDLDDDTGTARKLAYYDNRAAQVGLDWDAEQMLADLGAGLDLSAMFKQDELDELLADLQPKTTGDTPAEVDRAEELRQKWGAAPGQLWQLGEHRLICGDCTDAATVARVMGGERAALVHADPPYGMGKEKDGIANDNLYREKLDAFQMAWWRACRSSLDDNGSVYIWGNADDLWRLWYCGGLRDSERLTLRNEIVWQKQGAQGIRSESHRQYPTASERCLFFMLGEQGFSNNADNYWDGFTPIVEYLEAQRKAAGWSIKDTKRIAGHSENSGCHWFDKSQWIMPTQEVYNAWQEAARGAAFRREYDDLRREYDDLRKEYDDLRKEWYSTRAHFDNTHDNMTDVWQFGRVTGDDRHDHATPKPTDMIARVVKSSAPDGAIVYAPFGGTLPEVIACENLRRRCRAVEISPAYVAVALERWSTHTGKTPVLV